LEEQAKANIFIPESKLMMEKGTILIVDDNKGVLASLELLLETAKLKQPVILTKSYPYSILHR
jgi:CheY-like chemotaxis protein